MKDLDQSNKRTKWVDRDPYAYWKGNPFVAEHRKDLLKCNVSDTQDWNARLYVQVLNLIKHIKLFFLKYIILIYGKCNK